MWVAVGAAHSCAVREAGEVVCWGRDDDGQASPPPDLWAVEISSGAQHTCSIDVFGGVTCWGRATYGRLEVPEGLYLSVSSSYVASCGQTFNATVTCWAGLDDPPIGDITHYDVGRDHACAIDGLGNPVCWGSDSAGQSTPRYVQLD